MSTVLPKLKNFYHRYERFVRKFMFTEAYLCLISVILFVGWITECAPFGLGALIGVTCLMLLGADDFLPFTVNFFGAIMCIYSYDPNDFLYLWYLGIPLGLCMIFFFVKNARRPFRLGKLFFPQLAVSFAWLLGGLGTISGADYLRALPDCLLMGFGLLLVYELFHHYVKSDGEHDSALWFAKALVWIGLILSLEVLVFWIRAKLPADQWHTVIVTNGWGNRNSIATYLCFTIGMTFYLSTRYRHSWVYLLLAFFQYLCLLMTFSRGGILMGTLTTILGAVFSVAKSPQKLRQLGSYAIALVGVAIVVGFFHKQLTAMVDSLIFRGLGSSGRDELYKEAWDLFTAHPFLGAGHGYVGTNTHVNGIAIYWFHDTVLQVLANCGIVGFLAFAYNYGIRGYLLFRRPNHSFHLFTLAAWVGFEGYSLLNTGTMIFYPSMMMIMMMVVLLEHSAPQKPNYELDIIDTVYLAVPLLQRLFPRKLERLRSDHDDPVCN